MVNVMLVYSTKTVDGGCGIGRFFYDCPHLPMTMNEILETEQKLMEEHDEFKNAFIINIIPVAEESTKRSTP